jgi:hypothetical protein
MANITTRSKVKIYWSTEPCNVGYGVPNDWKSGKPYKITSPMKAIHFPYELKQRIGQGVFVAIAYFIGNEEISKEDLQYFESNVEYNKLRAKGKV